MRDFLTDEEKLYIKANIFDPLASEMEKIVYFERIDRGLQALNSSISSLKFDKKMYDAKFVMEDMGVPKKYKLRLLGRRKDCKEIVSLDIVLTTR
jgi:hypothetical protein